jgi:AraC-like DNA-binding protein
MRSPPYEVVIHQSPDVRVGMFRCPVEHPEFRTAGPIEGYTIAFPRTAVWIENQGSRPFVADPHCVTICNRGQPYVRAPISADGDRDDWFSLSRELALAVATEVDPAAADHPDRPFRASRVSSDSRLYLRQRLLLGRIERNELSALGIAQEVSELIAAVLRRIPGRPRRPAARTRSAQRDLVEAAKAELARDPKGSLSLHELAGRVGASPYHLCRVFRAWTGRTLHDYQLELRIRTAMEVLAAGERDLSALAHRLGFSSHSHFGAVFRRVTGRTPSRVRNWLIAGARRSA